MRYHSHTDFRKALEERLRQRERETGEPLVRMRKRLVFERCMVRLQKRSDSPWVVKGGFALELRLGMQARMTKDLDLGVDLGYFNEARSLRQKTIDEAEALLRATVSCIDGDLRRSGRLTTVQDLASHEKGSFRSGPFGSALLHSEFVPEGIPAIGIQDVQENEFALTRRWNVTPQKAEQLKRYTIKPHDILVTVMGTLGRACVVPEGVPHMVSTKHVWTITLDRKKAEPRWVSSWLNFARTVKEDLLGQGTGTAIPGLNGEKIRATSLPAIPLTEQRRIVAYLDDLQAKVDALKKLQAETSAELDALLPSILDKAFKGDL